MRRRFVAVLAATTMATLVAVGLPSAASAGTGIVKTVVNADGGVYWRGNPPDWNAPIRNPGYGVYNGDRIELECWTTGSTVPPYWNNTLWYYAQVISGRGMGAGYVNDHQIDTGINQPNIKVPGVRQCGAAAAPPPASPIPISLPGSVFFSGTNDPHGGTGQQVAGIDYPLKALKGAPSCSLAASTTIPNGTSTLAGWSGGRLGPLYFLRSAAPAQYKQVHQIILIDPGNSSDFVPCDAKVDANKLLASWLKADKRNQLLVMTGLRSEEKAIAHRFGKSTFAGLWKYYFAGLWNQPFANRALVCDYNNAKHDKIMQEAWGVVKFPSAGCPVLTNESLPVAWHP